MKKFYFYRTNVRDLFLCIPSSLFVYMIMCMIKEIYEKKPFLFSLLTSIFFLFVFVFNYCYYKSKYLYINNGRIYLDKTIRRKQTNKDKPIWIESIDTFSYEINKEPYEGTTRYNTNHDIYPRYINLIVVLVSGEKRIIDIGNMKVKTIKKFENEILSQNQNIAMNPDFKNFDKWFDEWHCSTFHIKL